ncbi:hypothetical protein AAE478_009170 [Parahypoxylon ruwenzoriense]
MTQLAKRGVNVITPKYEIFSAELLANVLEGCSRIMPPVKGFTYAGGCSFQDALARYRVGHGRKAVSIDIGWMRNISIIAETRAYQRQRKRPADFLVEGQTPSALVTRPLFASFSHVIGETKSSSKQLSSYGVGSLAAVELRNWIGKSFQVSVAVFDIMENVPVSAIGDLVVYLDGRSGLNPVHCLIRKSHFTYYALIGCLSDRIHEVNKMHETFDATPNTQSSLLALPLELRLMIYRGVLENIIREGIVCKQVYFETAPLVYRAVYIANRFNRWLDFFQRIGPYNSGLIRFLRVFNHCWLTPCRDEDRDGFKTRGERWKRLFESVRLTCPNIQRLEVCISCCDKDVIPIPTYNPYYNPFESFNSNKLREIEPEDYSQFDECFTYKDLAFVKEVSYFRNIPEIRIMCDFNPLWGFFLHQKLGFILIREDWQSWRLFNPNYFQPDVNLTGCNPSPAIKGVYDLLYCGSRRFNPMEWEPL